MQIGFLYSENGWGGLELNMKKLACWLRERSVEIIFFTVENTKADKEIKDANFKVHNIQKPRKYFDILTARSISKALDSYPELSTLFIFANWDIDVAVFTKIIRKNQLNLVYQQQMQIGINKKDVVHTWRYSKLDAWISPLKVIADDTLAKTKVVPEKINIIPLGIDSSQLQSTIIDKEEAIAHFGLSGTKPILGILGRIDPSKGQDTLVKAVYILKDKYGIEVDALIMGEPTINDEHSTEYYGFIQKEINTLGIASQVHFRPFDSNIGRFFSAINGFVMASKSETYGMVTLEAMVAGIPVIGTNAGGTVELLNFGEFGFLFTPYQHEELADKIKELLSDEVRLQSICELAQKKAKEWYAHDNECEKIISLIQSLEAKAN